MFKGFGHAALGYLFTFQSPGYFPSLQVHVYCNGLPVMNCWPSFSRRPVLPNIPTIRIVGNGFFVFVGVDQSEGLPRRNSNHDVSVAGLNLPDLKLANFAWLQWQVANETRPGVIVVLFDDTYGVGLLDDAEKVPMRILKERKELERGKFAMKLIQIFLHHQDFQPMMFLIFIQTVNLKVFLFILQVKVFLFLFELHDLLSQLVNGFFLKLAASHKSIDPVVAN